jgi:succinate dehydrogenase / fumarate reductase flavoprotein subunit
LGTRKQEDAKAIREGKSANDIAEEDRDYYLERAIPAFGNLVPRDVASRAAKVACDEGLGVAPTGLAVFLDFASAIDALRQFGSQSQKYDNPDQACHHQLGEAWYQKSTVTFLRCTKRSPVMILTKRQ